MVPVFDWAVSTIIVGVDLNANRILYDPPVGRGKFHDAVAPVYFAAQ